MRQRLLALLFAAPFVAVAGPAAAITIDWVAVGNPGNAPDTTSTGCYGANCGSVPYEYFISKYEITNAQYVEFLNAKAASDPLGLYPELGDHANRVARNLSVFHEGWLREHACRGDILQHAPVCELAE